MSSPLIRPTERGLYCEAGGFYIDPWRPVDKAVVSHAHSDHARWGCKNYLTSRQGRGVLQARLGNEAVIETLNYGKSLKMGDVLVSLHPAGHILGSSQVRVERKGEVWVFSGDYKTAPDETCTPYEPVACHTFITESTFGLPVFRWRPQADIFADVNNWWRTNREAGRPSIIFSYSLGKAQRLLAGLDATIGPIFVHGAVEKFLPIYAAEGIVLPAVRPSTLENAAEARGAGMVIAPPSAMGSPWMKKFAPASLAFASGWMAIRGTRRRQGLDRGFVLSDHADWAGLLDAIRATGAESIGVTHGYIEPLVRYLREELALNAFEVPTRYQGEENPGEDTEDAGPGTTSSEVNLEAPE